MAERQAPASGQWLSDEDLQQVTKSSPRIRSAFHFSIPFASSPPVVISLLEGSHSDYLVAPPAHAEPSCQTSMRSADCSMQGRFA